MTVSLPIGFATGKTGCRGNASAKRFATGGIEKQNEKLASYEELMMMNRLRAG